MLLTGSLAGQTTQPIHSALWGAAGEKWSAEGRLPDFSYAGFEYGEKPLPDLADAPRRNVRDFGARGDGQTDDTAAFHAALKEVESGIIEVPAGRYVITDFLDITRSNVVLRGAGPGQTILYFPKTLTDVKPNWGATTAGQRTSNYSWSGGFVRIVGRNPGRRLGAIAEPARRGARELVLEGEPAVKAGDLVRLVMSDDEPRTLVHYIYGGDPGDIELFRRRFGVSQTFRVEAIDGSRIHLDRPLRFDVRNDWKPELHTYAPTVTHAGIEGFTLEFPANDYQGHFTELGHNGIALQNVAHCWVRNIHLKHAESGIFIGGQFCTVTDITMESERRPDAYNNHGHHAILIGGQDNLLTNFDIRSRYIHDLTVSLGSIGNVIARGRGADLNLDHHKHGPYGNLFTALDAGQGTRLWASGGGRALGRNAAAYNTYWNIRADKPFPLPRRAFAPALINLVGLATTDTAEQADGAWFEPIAPEALQPQDLHAAQLQRRLAGAGSDHAAAQGR